MPPVHWDINFPHIRDAILLYALEDGDDSTIRVLRLTQRAIHDYIDRRIVQHVECSVQSFNTTTAIGHVRLAFESENVASLVRVLDVVKGSSNDVRAWPAVSFPHLKYARLLCPGHRMVLDWLIADSSNVILIIPIVTSRPEAPYQTLRIHTGPSVTRTITLLPAPENRRPLSTEDMEDLTALGNRVGKQPTGLLQYRRGFVSCITTVDIVDDADTGDGSDQPEYIRVGGGSGSCLQRIKDCVVAGQADLTLAMVIEVEHYGGPAWRFDRRYVSVVKWREELSNEEWDLIDSIPESVWRPN